MSKKDLVNLDEVLEKLNKEYGVNTIYKMNEATIQPVEVISTGSMALDKALGVGGLPRGRLVELYGSEGVGKSSLALSTIVCAQKQGLKCFFIDVEHAFSATLAEGMGIKLDELFFCQPDYGEQALAIVEELVASGHFGLGVVDSVSSLVPKVELDGEITDQQVGLQARLMGKHCRRAIGSIFNTNTCLIYINQIRAKIGGFGYGPQTDTPGGKALKFHSSVRLNVKRTGSVKEKDVAIGNELEIEVVKNKLAPPLKKAKAKLIFGKGFSKKNEIIEMAIELDIIQKKGHTFNYKEEKLGVGLPAVQEILESNTILFNEIEGLVLVKL